MTCPSVFTLPANCSTHCQPISVPWADSTGTVCARRAGIEKEFQRMTESDRTIYRMKLILSCTPPHVHFPISTNTTRIAGETEQEECQRHSAATFANTITYAGS